MDAAGVFSSFCGRSGVFVSYGVGGGRGIDGDLSKASGFTRRNVSKGLRNVGDQRRIDRYEQNGTPCGVTRHHMLRYFAMHFGEAGDDDNERLSDVNPVDTCCELQSMVKVDGVL